MSQAGSVTSCRKSYDFKGCDKHIGGSWCFGIFSSRFLLTYISYSYSKNYDYKNVKSEFVLAFNLRPEEETGLKLHM